MNVGPLPPGLGGCLREIVFVTPANCMHKAKALPSPPVGWPPGTEPIDTTTFRDYMDMDTVERIYSKKEGLLMAAVVQRLICGEEGQGLAEYAIIIATVALVVIGAVSTFGSAVKALFDVPFLTNE